MEIENIISTLRQKFEGIARYGNQGYEKTLINLPRYFDAEIINAEDLIYANAHENNITFIFIITSKLYIKLIIGEDGLRYRTEHIIQRDIKKVSSTESSVDIYFHGLHDPQTINVDNYEAALKLQRHLTDLRDRKHIINDNRQKR